MIFTLVACEDFVNIEGQVFDDNTGEPIQNARVTVSGLDISDSSDIIGSFRINQLVGFNFKPELVVEKEGYKAFKMGIVTGSSSSVYRVTTETEPFDFDEPIYPNPENRKNFVVSSSIEKYSQNFSIKGRKIVVYLEQQNPEAEKKKIIEKLKYGG